MLLTRTYEFYEESVRVLFEAEATEFDRVTDRYYQVTNFRLKILEVDHDLAPEDMAILKTRIFDDDSVWEELQAEVDAFEPEPVGEN